MAVPSAASLVEITRAGDLSRYPPPELVRAFCSAANVVPRHWPRGSTNGGIPPLVRSRCSPGMSITPCRRPGWRSTCWQVPLSRISDCLAYVTRYCRLRCWRSPPYAFSPSLQAWCIRAISCPPDGLGFSRAACNKPISCVSRMEEPMATLSMRWLEVSIL